MIAMATISGNGIVFLLTCAFFSKIDWGGVCGPGGDATPDAEIIGGYPCVPTDKNPFLIILAFTAGCQVKFSITGEINFASAPPEVRPRCVGADNIRPYKTA